MITTINENDFIQAFKTMGRDANFSHKALQELFKYYEEYEDSTGETVELDVIATCCDWTEYKSQHELLNNYDMTLKEIKDNTTVIEFDAWNDPKYSHKTHYLILDF